MAVAVVDAGGADDSIYGGSDTSVSVFVHSRTSMAEAGEGSLTKPHKRKRTSPQDHALLEAAYLKNSKPDKTERLSLLSQIQLSEKEIQIWFQNRRQSDRRRSKPLQPHELIAHIRATTSPSTPIADTSNPAPRATANQAELDASLHSHPAASTGSTVDQTQEACPVEAEDDPTSSVQTVSEEHILTSSLVDAAVQTPPSSHGATVESGHAQGTPTVSALVDANSPSSSSARKRSHDEMSEKKCVSKQSSPIKLERGPPKSKEPLKRSSSVRLAVTAEGAVKIRTNDEVTPSPEKERPQPPLSLASQKKKIRPSRSISMFEDIDAHHEGSTSSSKPRVGAGFGRSRDARTWEFYCDSGAQDALSEQAEAERSGSAIGAINLIRSNSHKSRSPAMSPALSKGNVKLGGVSTRPGKPKFARAQSSLARLQSSEGDAEPRKQTNKGSRHFRSPSGDSDKENWAPGTRTSHNAMRRTEPSTDRRAVLQNNEDITYPDATQRQESGNKPALSHEHKPAGEEIACVQGLLSLSQGAWR